MQRLTATEAVFVSAH